jgi:dGTPase
MSRNSTDLTRKELETDEDRRLAPYAMRSAGARRSIPLDREGRIFDYRTEFQRDRDRILHSRAFRRLRLKSAGGAIPPNERFRDRLTHTLEVSQLCRTVARGLNLNEDLVEAIALGHELGMPPFGRAGEEALASLLRGAGGGFKYNYQSLRVVDRLEKRYDHPGINLTDWTREGILKHAAYEAVAAETQTGSEMDALHADWAPFFEAQVMAAVEEVASVVQDLDDGLRCGEIDMDAVEALPIVKELLRRIEIVSPGPRRPRRARRGGLFMRANVINRGLTHMLVTGIIHHSRRALRDWARAHKVDSHEAFLDARPTTPAGLIGLTPRGRRLFDGLRDFVARNLNQGAWLSGVGARARHLIAGLFAALEGDPRLADDYLLLRFKEECGGPYLRDVDPADMETEIARRYRGSVRFRRLVADHIAGMTDMFAVSEYERLLGPFLMGAQAR